MPTTLPELLELAYIAYLTGEEGLCNAVLRDTQHRHYPCSPEQIEIWKADIKRASNKAVKAA